MNKKQPKNNFSVEESPAGSKVVSIAKGRKKFHLKQIFAQTRKVIGFGKPFHGYLYLSIFRFWSAHFLTF